MARPEAADTPDTRQRLTNAAADAFARNGVEATSLREIAQSAGVTIAAIHYYFGSKDGLRDACMDMVRKDLSKELAPLLAVAEETVRGTRRARPSPPDLRRLTNRMVRASIRLLRQQRTGVQLLMRGLSSDGELDRRWLRGVLAPFLGDMAQTLSGPLGVPVPKLRLRIQSVVALVFRHALSSEDELRLLAGVEDGDDEKIARLFEDHLVWAAHRLLFPD